MVQTRKELGNSAENAVVEYLEAAGATIVARNLRVGMLEIDVVARIETLILVVEVRYRSERSWTSAWSSLDGKKRMRIRRAGERLWNRRYKNDPTAERMRFDAASVTERDGRLAVEYVAGAF